MNITKDQADKVIAALESGRIMGYDYAIQSYSREVTPKIITEALTIMRGLADAEPVAQIHSHHLRANTDGTEWCREVLLYSPNNEGDKLNGVNVRVKLYASPKDTK